VSSRARKVSRKPSLQPLEGAEPPHGAAAYQRLARSFAKRPGITLPAEKRGKFGSNGLAIDGKVFAMCVGGRLVVKLPEADVDAAVAAARGERLRMGARVMKQWLVVLEPEERWLDLARRACAFVAAEVKRR
jgi:hypothetical protein